MANSQFAAPVLASGAQHCSLLGPFKIKKSPP
jgi:hypothetical protein